MILIICRYIFVVVEWVANKNQLQLSTITTWLVFTKKTYIYVPKLVSSLKLQFSLVFYPLPTLPLVNWSHLQGGANLHQGLFYPCHPLGHVLRQKKRGRGWDGRFSVFVIWFVKLWFYGCLMCFNVFVGGDSVKLWFHGFCMFFLGASVKLWFSWRL